ncbi:unnamed protein product [Rhizophagus irregularis]|uniref:Uncharacterized protein n=1 Tax=Rhizophagus irregularis TaxID=588596 RepID=A0A2N1NFC8_9GLOM|nr:hypothetical protein RhiirC2_864966 [Rhizophagus irregularis]CAB4392343.1 unnamed protein product [Rhizophagus irregularis]CAB5345233.1 unnamed protein product [Rhizophagus irregularis]
MVIQDHGNLCNYVLMKGESKGIIEVREFESKSQGKGEVIYTKTRHKVHGGAYVAKLLDPITQAVLAEVQGKKSSAKLKQLLLYQPDECIELKDNGILSFDYRFLWEEEKYVWKKRNILVGRELECKMVHGDDPGIGVCMYKQESKTLGCITVMYYNMERIPVKDKRGLEYLLIISLLSILDKWDDENITKSKNEYILDDESNIDILKEKKENVKLIELKEKEKKKSRNKKEDKLIIKLAEEEAILQEKLRQLKAQEKDDEEYARQLQLKLSDPNYNEEEETSNQGKSTSNNSREDSTRPTSTYSPDNSTEYKTILSTNNDKKLRPPTPPSSSSSSKYAHNYSSTTTTTLSSNNSLEQEEYYRKRPPPTPPSPAVSYPAVSSPVVSSPSPPPNLYPAPWSYPYNNTNTNSNNGQTYTSMPMPSIPSIPGYPPNNYNNGTATSVSGYYGTTGTTDSQFNNFMNQPASNTSYNYPPYQESTNNNGYGEYNYGYNNGGYNNGYNNGYNGYNGYNGGNGGNGGGYNY